MRELKVCGLFHISPAADRYLVFTNRTEQKQEKKITGKQTENKPHRVMACVPHPPAFPPNSPPHITSPLTYEPLHTSVRTLPTLPALV